MFEKIKSVVSMPMVLERYTNYQKGKRIDCPLHGGDKCFKVSDNWFCCYSCGQQGDVVQFVGALMGVSSGEAAAIIESDFGLTKPDDWMKAKREHEKKQRKIQHENRIESRVWNLLCTYERRMKRMPWDDHEVLLKLPMITYYCDEWLEMTFKERLEWIQENTKFLSKIAKRLKEIEHAATSVSE